MHSNSAGSLESQVILCLGLLVSLGLSLVVVRTGGRVSTKIRSFQKLMFWIEFTSYTLNRPLFISKLKSGTVAQNSLSMVGIQRILQINESFSVVQIKKHLTFRINE